MFESVRAGIAGIRVERARAALRKAKDLEARRVARALALEARLARKVERAARKWEAAREAESVKELRRMARRNLRRGVVIDVECRPW